MALYAEALRDLGRFLGDRRRSTWSPRPAARPSGWPRCSPRGMPFFDDRGFWKRAQITAERPRARRRGRVPRPRPADDLRRQPRAARAARGRRAASTTRRSPPASTPGELLAAGRRGARDPRLRGARLRAARGAPRDAAARCSTRRCGTAARRPSTRRVPRHRTPDGLLLTASRRRCPGRRGAAGGGPRRSGLRPVCSATSSSSSFRRLARPLIASATGSGRWAQSASGPSGLRPSTRTGWPGLPTTVEFGGHVVDHHRVRADLRARRRSRSGRAAWRRRRSSPRRPTVGWRLPRAKPVPPSVTPW